LKTQRLARFQRFSWIDFAHYACRRADRATVSQWYMRDYHHRTMIRVTA
jgi:hypothetical protein